MANANYKHLDATGLTQVWAAILQNFVAKEAGKGLSSNDLTGELLTKLNGIAAGAQVNVIEGVQLNGVDISIVGKKVNVTVPTGALASLDKVGSDQLDTTLASLINSHATTTYVNTELGKKADKATTLAGYGITDAYGKGDVYTKGEADTAIGNAVNAAVSGVYKVRGSVAFASLALEGQSEGYIYNVTDAFQTTADFVEGAGKSYPAGTNVVAVKVGEALKWDAMAGIYDFSDFVMKTDIASLTEAEITAICVMPS